MSASLKERRPSFASSLPISIELITCVLLPVIIVALRLPAFFYSAVGLDETLYFLMAHNVLHGSLPYVLTFDNKPPGIYAIFASAILIFGHGMLAIRIAACIAIGYGCFAIYRLTLLVTNNRHDMAITAPYLYVLYTSHLSGLEANTEIFLMPFVATAFYFVWPTLQRSASGLPWPNYVFAGLAFGIAISIKQTAGFDLIAAAICILVFDTRRFRFLGVVCMCASSLLPLLLIVVPYLISNQMHVLLTSVVQANVRRVSIPISLSKQISHFGRQLIVFFPVLELQLIGPLFILVRKSAAPAQRQAVLVASFWFIMDAISAIALGNFASHWALPLLMPSIVAAVIILFDAIDLIRVAKGAKNRIALTFLFIVAVFQATGPLMLAGKVLQHRKGRGTDALYVDRVPILTAYLSQRLRSNESIFIVSPESADIYALSGAKVPTRYGFSYFLATPDGIRIASVDVGKEVDRIFTLRPRFVILEYPRADDFEPSFLALAGGAGTSPTQNPASKLRQTWQNLLRIVRGKLKGNYSPPQLVSGMYVYSSLPSTTCQPVAASGCKEL